MKLSKKCKLIIFLFMVIPALSGCYRMKIHNGSSIRSRNLTAQYYHQGLMESVPLSDAVTLEGNCPMENWQSLTIQRTPLNFLLSAPTAYLYSQWTVQAQCGYE